MKSCLISRFLVKMTPRIEKTFEKIISLLLLVCYNSTKCKVLDSESR